MRSIVEDVEFCGWYLCGFDRHDGVARDDGNNDDRARLAREARKRDAESTFLGREIEVLSCGGNPFCIAL